MQVQCTTRFKDIELTDEEIKSIAAIKNLADGKSAYLLPSSVVAKMRAMTLEALENLEWP